MIEAIPKCPACAEPLKRDEAMCQCVESKLPQMEFHRADVLARRILYLEGRVDLLLGMIQKPPAAKAKKLRTPKRDAEIREEREEKHSAVAESTD